MQVATERAPWRPSACAEVAAHINGTGSSMRSLSTALRRLGFLQSFGRTAGVLTSEGKGAILVIRSLGEWLGAISNRGER